MAKVSLFFLFFVVTKGETSVVQTQQNVTAAAGGEAHLSCRLTQPKDVFQVTWQKIVSGSEENIGSYSEQYGERVVPKFRGKVLINPGMQNSSIVVRNVSEEDGGCYLCLFSADPERTLKGETCLHVYGETSKVQTQQNVTAAAGGEAHLSCRLTQPEEVLQILWDKIVSGVKENIASYNEYHGKWVDSKFNEKILIIPGMQTSSIIMRNVSEEDGGCYLCLFNIPEGSLKGRTCLQVYELHPPVMHVRASDSESVVICSATGRPAPNLTLTVGQQHLNSFHDSTVNHNNTVTVTAAAVLSGLGSDSTRVGCSAAVFSGPQLPASLLLHGLDVDPRSVHGRGSLAVEWIAVIVGTVVMVGALCFSAVFMSVIRSSRHSQERIERPSKTKEEKTIKTVI